MSRDEGPGPQRTCVGCRAVRAQRHLVRVARTGEGTLVLSRTLPGRGAWLCQDSPSCLDRAIRQGGFSRSFRTSVSAASLEDLRAIVSG